MNAPMLMKHAETIHAAALDAERNHAYAKAAVLYAMEEMHWAKASSLATKMQLVTPEREKDATAAKKRCEAAHFAGRKN